MIPMNWFETTLIKGLLFYLSLQITLFSNNTQLFGYLVILVRSVPINLDLLLLVITIIVFSLKKCYIYIWWFICDIALFMT